MMQIVCLMQLFDNDAIVCLISSALIGGNVHKLGKDSLTPSVPGAQFLLKIFEKFAKPYLASS